MFAIAFDLLVADTAANYRKGASQAYADIGAILSSFGFGRVRESLYLADRDDLTNVFSAIIALKSHPWFPSSVRGIRAFKVEHWSDFTQLVKA